MKRPNLSLFIESHAQRLLLDGARAVGVEHRDRAGRVSAVHAMREVLLAAGAIHSPAILQLSGVGSADVLRGAGIEAHIDLPGIGQNLQDHLSVPVIKFSREAVTLVDAERPINLIKFFAQRRGMLTSNVGEGVAFCRSAPGIEHPDLEIIFAPVPFIKLRSGSLHQAW